MAGRYNKFPVTQVLEAAKSASFRAAGTLKLMVQHPAGTCVALREKLSIFEAPSLHSGPGWGVKSCGYCWDPDLAPKPW